jgi:hypothetical protein
MALDQLRELAYARRPMGAALRIEAFSAAAISVDYDAFHSGAEPRR